MPGCSAEDTPLLSEGTFSETIVSESSSSPCSLLLLVSTGRDVPSTKSNISHCYQYNDVTNVSTHTKEQYREKPISFLFLQLTKYCVTTLQSQKYY